VKPHADFYDYSRSIDLYLHSSLSLSKDGNAGYTGLGRRMLEVKPHDISPKESNNL